MKNNLIYHAPVTMQKNVLAGNDHAKYFMQLEAIARDGISLQCDQDTLSCLLPNTASIAPRQTKHLEVNFVIPTSESAIQCQCEVYSLRRISRDCFQLDMKFENLNAEQDRAIDEYIETALHNPQKIKPTQADTKRIASKVDRSSFVWSDLSKFFKHETRHAQAA